MKLESEKDTERYLVEQVEKIGGLCRKYTSPGVRGVPDRICFFPEGHVYFVELKSEGEAATDHQLREHQRLFNVGTPVSVIDTKAGVDLLIDIIRRLYGILRSIYRA